MHRRTAANEMGRLAGTHIHNLHIVVAVPRESHKPGVGAYGDQLVLAQQLGRINLKTVACGVQRPIQRLPIPQFLFLRCDTGQRP